MYIRFISVCAFSKTCCVSPCFFWRLAHARPSQVLWQGFALYCFSLFIGTLLFITVPEDCSPLCQWRWSSRYRKSVTWEKSRSQHMWWGEWCVHHTTWCMYMVYWYMLCLHSITGHVLYKVPLIANVILQCKSICMVIGWLYLLDFFPVSSSFCAIIVYLTFDPPTKKIINNSWGGCFDLISYYEYSKWLSHSAACG